MLISLLIEYGPAIAFGSALVVVIASLVQHRRQQRVRRYMRNQKR